MKKLSLLIALGSLCLLSIAEPTTNTIPFSTYAQQMQTLAQKYLAEKQLENANKVISKLAETYSHLSDKEKKEAQVDYAKMNYTQAILFAQNNELYNALKSLKIAVKNGYTDIAQIQNNKALESLKQFDSFNKIIQSIPQK